MKLKTEGGKIHDICIINVLKNQFNPLKKFKIPPQCNLRTKFIELQEKLLKIRR